MITFPRTAVELHLAGQETVIATPNIVAFYNHGQEYHRKKLSEVGDWCEWFQFSPMLLAEAIKQYDPEASENAKRPFRRSHTPISPQTLLLQRQIIQHLFSTQPPDNWWLKEISLLLLDKIIADKYRHPPKKSSKKKLTQKSHQELVIETQKFLFKNLNKQLRLEELAQQAHSSPFHLARVFRQITGKTIHSYLKQLRLRMALEWLPDYKNNLSGLALAVGYKNHSHFTQAFQDVFGVPPSHIPH